MRYFSFSLDINDYTTISLNLYTIYFTSNKNNLFNVSFMTVRIFFQSSLIIYHSNNIQLIVSLNC